MVKKIKVLMRFRVISDSCLPEELYCIDFPERAPPTSTPVKTTSISSDRKRAEIVHSRWAVLSRVRGFLGKCQTSALVGENLPKQCWAVLHIVFANSVMNL